MSNLSDIQVLFYYDLAVALGDYECIKDLKKELESRGLQ